jgi:transposase
MGTCHQRHRQQEFVKFLDHIDQSIAETPGETIHIVMDNYATHKTARVQRWLAKRPRYQVHFTLTSASWLNQVERFFAEITRKRIRRSAFRSVPSLKKAIHSYLDQHNEDPKPFKWTADADLILNRVANVCKRITISGH